MTSLNSSLKEWGTVAAHAEELKDAHLRDLAAADPKRWQSFHVLHDSWLLDMSRQRITAKTLPLLFDLARAADLPARRAAMFRGDPINSTEQRAVLHTALRSDFAGPAAVQAEVRDSRKKLADFAAAVRSGRKLGTTGKKFKHVVNIGIGGSDLGPLLVCDALKHEWSGCITPHFVSNVDRTQLEDLIRSIDPAETLVIVCSKTFVTQETQANANAARAWIVGALGEKSPANHFVAVSTNASAMDAFGIAQEHRFTMCDWVGGRYSVWSAIGLVAELTIGSDKFQEFLSGAGEIDQHFTKAPFESNLPVLMGLLGVWNRTFLGLPTLAVLPYDQRLARLPAYLQQLEMESNGKSVRLDGRSAPVPTCPVIWGEPGSNAQHSFFQLLHQGSARAACDFLLPVISSCDSQPQQELAIANALAQAEAFALGQDAAQVEVALRRQGLPPARIAELLPHKIHPGSRPVTLIMFPRLDPPTLGRLLALYEHKVFVQ